jgi:hypothetical protein
VTCEDEFRPISLTASLSKILEDFVVNWMMNDVKHKIDPQQFGCFKGTSTTFCLIDMINNWLRTLDNQSSYLRICFLDFSKAFDRIGHNILVSKLLCLGVRESDRFKRQLPSSVSPSQRSPANRKVFRTCLHATASKSSPRKALFSSVQEQSQHQPKDNFLDEHINVSNLFEINETQVKVTI